MAIQWVKNCCQCCLGYLDTFTIPNILRLNALAQVCACERHKCVHCSSSHSALKTCTDSGGSASEENICINTHF